MDKHIITHVGIVDAQVCSAGTYEEALSFIRSSHPAGTQNNWQKNEDGNFAPIACNDNPKRTHYMFNC